MRLQKKNYLIVVDTFSFQPSCFDPNVIWVIFETQIKMRHQKGFDPIVFNDYHVNTLSRNWNKEKDCIPYELKMASGETIHWSYEYSPLHSIG